MPLGPIATCISEGREAVLEGLCPSGLAYLLACEALARPLVVVTAEDERAERLAEDLRAFGAPDVELFTREERLPFEDVSPDPSLVAQRLAVRRRIILADHGAGRPRVVVANAAALQGRWMPEQDFRRSTDTWRRGQQLGRERITQQLVLCGYQPVPCVEDEGTFAVRGGIVDLFPPGWGRPIRLDLFGDELETLQVFEPETQRSCDRLESLVVHPIREVVFDDETVARARARVEELGDRDDLSVPSRRLRTLLEEIEQRHYFYGIEGLWPAFYERSEPVTETLLGDDVVVVLDEAVEFSHSLHVRWEKAVLERDKAREHHLPVLEVREHLESPERVLRAIERCARVRCVTVADDRGDSVLPIRLGDYGALAREIEARRQDTGRGEILDPVIDELRRCFANGEEVLLTCGSRGNAERLRELLRGRQIDLPILDALPEPASLGRAGRSPRRAIVVASLAGGIHDPHRGVAILTDTDIFGKPPRRKRRGRRRATADGLVSLRDLTENDPIIHVDHGVGRYLGLSRLILNGVDGDYVHLEYAGGDRLYVPVYRLNVLQRYVGDPAHARIDKLGGTRWEKTKQRVKDAVLSIAHELLAMQAKRAGTRGFALSPPSDHFRAFEVTFPYEETPDQHRAIREVLEDLGRDRPMDRLVCGDVGYGKTEVAVRAAFLAVLSGKQAAVLVPTTVLAEQHGATFAERLTGEAVNVEVLSRFRSPKETREILSRVRSGAADILIGTHRLLSPDVAFKDLGLLVVDEEQRFGVKHKERIKQLRAHVHVLTMTATPIPRTLHMATVGLRDLSVIQTAPAERVGIRTEVTRFSEATVSEAIRRELRRGGQVFVVHNRVHSIEAMAAMVRRVVPEARVAVAHGQMRADQLERIMVEFVRRVYNVLVCTAIIESGLDIPSANTMIVNRADTFGLSQLYQLRGRIGRGRDRAYAYLLLPRSDRITADAAQRLAVLKRFSDLGSGFQIASHDLELRGAGDLLGADQSGHIAAVGFELYTELLGEAVERARGESRHHDVEPDIRLPVAAVLPESYVPDPMLRLAFYQRMAQASTDEEIFDVCAEVEDRYGEPPPEVSHLAEVMVIRRRLKSLGASSLSAAAEDGQVKMGMTFIPEAAIDREDLVRRCQQQPERYRLLASGRFAITVEAPRSGGTQTFLEAVRHEIGDLRVGGSFGAVGRQ